MYERSAYRWRRGPVALRDRHHAPGTELYQSTHLVVELLLLGLDALLVPGDVLLRLDLLRCALSLVSGAYWALISLDAIELDGQKRTCSSSRPRTDSFVSSTGCRFEATHALFDVVQLPDRMLDDGVVLYSIYICSLVQRSSSNAPFRPAASRSA